MCRSLLVLTLAACAPTVGPLVDGGVDAVDEAQPLGVPDEHRDAMAVCPAQRGANPPKLDAGYEGGSFTCQSDDQCDAGANGRCFVVYGGFPDADIPMGTSCTYDACSTDTACPPLQVCLCRSSATDPRANTCTFGSGCRIDSDCASGFCSPATQCGGTSQFQCHVAGDTCLSDFDCSKNGGGSCQYDPHLGHFVCAGCPLDGGT